LVSSVNNNGGAAVRETAVSGLQGQHQRTALRDQHEHDRAGRSIRPGRPVRRV